MICMISHSVETPRGTGAFFFNTLRLRHPMRAGIFSVLLFSSQPLRLFNPLALRALPLYFAAQNTPQCYGTRQGRRVKKLHLITEHKSLGGLMVDFFIFQNTG